MNIGGFLAHKQLHPKAAEIARALMKTGRCPCGSPLLDSQGGQLWSVQTGALYGGRRVVGSGLQSAPKGDLSIVEILNPLSALVRNFMS